MDNSFAYLPLVTCQAPNHTGFVDIRGALAYQSTFTTNVPVAFTLCHSSNPVDARCLVFFASLRSLSARIIGRKLTDNAGRTRDEGVGVIVGRTWEPSRMTSAWWRQECFLTLFACPLTVLRQGLAMMSCRSCCKHSAKTPRELREMIGGCDRQFIAYQEGRRKRIVFDN